MASLYVETNFIVGYATGREIEADQLLAMSGESSVTLAIPSICFFEAGAWRESENRRRKTIGRQLSEQMIQLRRDLSSSLATDLHSHLEQAVIVNMDYFLSIDSRLSQVFDQLSSSAEWINLSPETLNRSRTASLIGEMTDDLILTCILHHARSHPEEPRAFLSGNTRDFGRQGVREALRESGVDRFFNATQDALGWLASPTG
jgi:hypothetical protein